MCVAKKYQLGGRFWTIAIVVGVMVACVSGMFGFGSVLREAAERSGNVVGFAKSQSLTYDSFNDSVAMTSQVLALETLLSLLIASPMVEMRSTKPILSVLHGCLAFQTRSF